MVFLPETGRAVQRELLSHPLTPGIIFFIQGKVNMEIYDSNQTQDFDLPISSRNFNLSDNQSVFTPNDGYFSVYRINTVHPLKYFFYTIIFVLGIPGNGLVIWIAGFKMKTVSAVWFLNLAIADFICCTSILLLFLVIAPLRIPFSGVIIILTITLCTSVCFLTAISIDRCVSVMWPIWSKTYRTPKCIRTISAIIWVVGLILTVSELFLYKSYKNMYNLNCRLKIIRFITMFIIPFTTILMCHYIIFLKLRKVKRPNRSQRPYKIITAVVICFFICWFPYYISQFIPTFDVVLVTDLQFRFSGCLASFNSCINPILYVFICQDFKETLMNSLPPRLRRAIDKCSYQSCRGREKDILPTTI
ncbi:formyl peptide receptor-related sequence 1-like [Mixophyes fleayi]|uniref:formyl peptide receptor-related sequence 1-like n=1 Tax=Mixophyes fleayi TaxID=3061075 RepID=UPI003F4E2AE8